MHPTKEDESVQSLEQPFTPLRSVLPPQIFAATDVFPISLVMPHLSGPMENRLSLLCSYLPSAEQATVIRQHYYDYVASVYVTLPSFTARI
jgi:hypothetical protein